MLVQMTVQVDGREVRVCKTLAGTPAEREEGVQGLLREVGRGIAEAALNEAAAQTQHPCCCGRPMENRGSRVRTLQGLQGALRIRRTRYRSASPAADQLCATPSGSDQLSGLPRPWLANRQRHD